MPGPVIHRRPVDGDGGHLLSLQRAMRWLRLLGIAIVLTQSWLYQLLHPVLLLVVVGLEIAVVASQGRLLAEGLPRATLHRRAMMLLVADMVAAYLIGTLFTPDEAWIGYYFYPLLSLEAAAVVGLWAGLTVTGISIVVYLAQLVLYVAFGHVAEPRTVAAAATLIAMTGGFVAAYAHLAGRGQEHLRALLSLTTELARHERQGEAIRHIDRRLYATIGARVRSVAVRDPDGWYRIIRWQTGEQRTLSSEQLLRAFGDASDLTRHFEAGDAVTVETDPWSLVTAALGLPEWASAITLVPIVSEGRWIGMLPVLWPTRTVPDADQLRLLHGLAGQVGLALARSELEQMRRDATVDPLTLLPNRRAIGAELAAFVARARRSGGQFGVLLLEFDRNDPATGPDDATLRSVAVAVRGALRGGDVAGRQDDDRLLVIAAGADTAAARILAGRIAAEIASMADGASLHLAVGIAAFPENGLEAADLVDAAEADLAATSSRPAAMADLVVDEAEAALA